MSMWSCAPASAWSEDAPLGAAPPGDGTVTCHLDIARSTILFHGHAFLHGFSGRATVLPSDIALGASAGHGVITVDAASMTTDNARRDRRMHAEVMESTRYGTISFALLRLEPAHDGLAAVGIWTMHGVARPLVVPITLAWSGAPTVHLAIDLDIRQWDIVPPTLLGTSVSDTVHVEATLALTPDATAAAVALPPGPDLAGVALASSVAHAAAAGPLPRPLGRVLVVAAPDQASIAAQQVGRLAARATTARRPLVVLTTESPVPGAWLDPHAQLRQALKLPDRPLLTLVLDDQGRELALDEGVVSDAEAARLTDLVLAEGHP